MQHLIRSETHGVFLDPAVKPVAVAQVNDEIIFETLDCFSGKITRNDQQSSLLPVEDINPATGPVFIEGAHPGDILKVEILDMTLGDSGLMAVDPNLGGLKKVLRQEVTRIFPLDKDTVRFNDTLTLPLRPMIGVIGTAPADRPISTDVPDTHGGNLDCTLIRPGVTVFLPVFVEGALLSIGDLHALMGDGEIVLCGLETSGRVTVRVSLLHDRYLPTPSVLDDQVFAAMVSASTLDEATEKTVYAMHAFLSEQIGMDPAEAGMLLSLVGNLKINQIVDPLLTVRMEIPRQYLQGWDAGL